jgi:hypothetical protein
MWITMHGSLIVIALRVNVRVVGLRFAVGSWQFAVDRARLRTSRKRIAGLNAPSSVDDQQSLIAAGPWVEQPVARPLSGLAGDIVTEHHFALRVPPSCSGTSPYQPAQSCLGKSQANGENCLRRKAPGAPTDSGLHSVGSVAWPPPKDISNFTSLRPRAPSS